MITRILALKVFPRRVGADGDAAEASRGLFLALFTFLCRLTGTGTVPFVRGDWDSRYTGIAESVQVAYKQSGLNHENP
jgi:hypothetical protein